MTDRFPHAKKALGQNFLHDPGMKEKILNLVCSKENIHIFEIGCGPATLSKELCRRSQRFFGVEKDLDMQDWLSPLVHLNKSIIHYGSVLDLSEDQLLKHLDPGFCIIGNLPYYLTSEILEHILLNFSHWEELYIMVQKEVAMRIVASEGCAEYSRLTVLCQLYSEAKKLFDVPGGCFQPAPKVKSSFLRLKRKHDPSFPAITLNLVKAGFLHRRKKLVNNLRQNPDFVKADEIFASLGWNTNLRAEQLAIFQWVELAREFERHF